jgi:hypothetical protein
LNQGTIKPEIINKEVLYMKNWDVHVKTLRNMLQHLHYFRDDKDLIGNPQEQETKLPK